MMSSSRSRKYLFEGLEARQLLTTFNPANGDALVAILNGTNSGTKLAMGDTIILNAGTNYQSTTFSSFNLRNITQLNTDPVNSGWITIESSNLASLPVGKRVSYTDGPNMPKLWAPGNNVSAVTTSAGANHYRFLGCEFVGFMQLTKDLTTTSLFSIIMLGDTSDPQTTVPGGLHEEPHDIVIDRSYIHPEYITVDYAGTHNGTARDSDAYLANTYSDLMVRKGIVLSGRNLDVTNSFVREIHEGSDSNAIYGENGSGPYNVINNELQGAGENVLFGGDTQRSPFVDSYMNFRGNHVIKPLDWRNGTNGSRKWTVKNLFEVKEGSHFVIDGNIFENSWVSGQDGVAILFKLGDYNDSYNANGGVGVVDEDMIFRNNIVRHAARGMTFQGRDYAATSPSDPGGLVRRLQLVNNVWYDIATKDANGNAIWGGISPSVYVLYGPKNVTIAHNSFMEGFTPLEIDDNTTTWSSPNFTYTDNIVNMNDYGIRGSWGSGDAAIQHYLPDSLFKGNVFIDNKAVGGYSAATGYDNVAPASWPGTKMYPRTRYVNFFRDNASNPVGFADANRDTNGNYSLTTTAANTYINGVAYSDTMESPTVNGTTKTTDGTAPGANFDVLNGATAGAISGVWQFAYVSGGRLFIHFDGSGTPISLSISGSNYVVSQAGQTTLTVPISSIAGINVVDSTGDDTLQVSGAISPALIQQTNTKGNDLISLSSGTFNFASDLAQGSQYWNNPNWGVYVASTATANFAASQHLRSLSVDGTANQNDSATTDVTTGTTNTVLDVGDLQVSGNGMLDLKDNDLIWDYSTTSPMGAWANGSYAQGLVTLIKNGRNRAGNGTLGQLFSSNTTAGDFSNTALGVREASSASNLDGKTFTTFDGVSLDSTAVLVKYTYAGDTNLSGKVDGDDYFSMDSGYAAHTGYFSNGDLNLDGKINADDYFVMDSKLNKQGSPL